MSRENMSIVQEYRTRPRQVLDRLVDGELGVEDRRALLAALDDEPGAWRQCALAFVEAQSFGWQLSRMANEPLVVPEPSSYRAQSASRRVGWFAWPLALAASVLVAFLVGQRVADDRGNGPELAGEARMSSGNDNSTVIVQGASVDPAGSERMLTSLTLRPYGGDDTIELPLVESDDAAVDAAGRSSAISGALARQFERDGFEVDRRQQFWPVELPDGRSVLVPVEEVHIQSPEVQRL